MKGFKTIQFKKEYSCTVITHMIDEDTPNEEDELFHKGDKHDVDVIDDHGTYVNVQFGDGSMLYGLQKKDFTVVGE